MRRLLAFAVAFLVTLAVALVPVAVSDLGRPRFAPRGRPAQYGPPPDSGEAAAEARREAASTTMIVTALSVARARALAASSTRLASALRIAASPRARRRARRAGPQRARL